MQGDIVQRLHRLLAVPLFGIYRGRNLFLQLSGIFLTILLVFSGIDWNFYRWISENDVLVRAGFFAALIGMFLPIVLPAILAVYGLITGRAWVKILAIALVQAAALSVLVSGSYKAFTGRAAPEYSFSLVGAPLHATDSDITRTWDFGFMNAGIFDGWPSGHTTTAFATATVLAALVRRRSIQTLAFIYALYIGLGVGVTIHWLSDAVAGMFLGIAIGRSAAATWKGGK